MRVLAPLDAVDHDGGLPPRFLGGDIPVPADGGAPGSTGRSPRLYDVDLAAAGVDPHPEAGQFPVPEYGVPVIDRERVDDSFAELDCILPGHGNVSIRSFALTIGLQKPSSIRNRLRSNPWLF